MNAWLTSAAPLIIGHRGASADAPENTLAAFALALDQGADGVELDVRLSADGEPVIIHDASVRRTTNGRGAVSRLTAIQLQALDAGRGEPVPTLDRLFAAFGRAMLYNVELKTGPRGNEALVAAVATQIARHDLAERVLVSSFSLNAVRQAQRLLGSRVPLALIHAGPAGRRRHRLAACQADHPDYRLVTPAYVAWAAWRGLRLHVWTVDDPDDARRLIALGVNALLTNRPAALLPLRGAPGGERPPDEVPQ
jgi:glycerophosphoryl diester phosphodiesterase